MKIKICGTRRMQDIEYYNRYKIDYAGFIFAKSPRRVTAEEAAKMTAALDDTIKAVGVFVNAGVEDIVSTAKHCRLDIIQLHGGETADFAQELKRRTGLLIWKAVRVKDRESLMAMQSYPADKLLLDAYSKDAYGGVGKSFDWSLMKGMDMQKIILAGGINAENAAAAARLAPYALDLNSGVETDGFKAADKIEAAVKIIRNTDTEEM